MILLWSLLPPLTDLVWFPPTPPFHFSLIFCRETWLFFFWHILICLSCNKSNKLTRSGGLTKQHRDTSCTPPKFILCFTLCMTCSPNQTKEKEKKLAWKLWWPGLQVWRFNPKKQGATRIPNPYFPDHSHFPINDTYSPPCPRGHHLTPCPHKVFALVTAKASQICP